MAVFSHVLGGVLTEETLFMDMLEQLDGLERF